MAPKHRSNQSDGVSFACKKGTDEYLCERNPGTVDSLDVSEHVLEVLAVKLTPNTLMASGSEQATSFGAMRTR